MAGVFLSCRTEEGIPYFSIMVYYNNAGRAIFSVRRRNKYYVHKTADTDGARYGRTHESKPVISYFGEVVLRNLEGTSFARRYRMKILNITILDGWARKVDLSHSDFW